MAWIVWPFVLFLTLLSFASGYGARELISRRRHAVAREKYYARKQYRARFRQRSESTSVTPLITHHPPATLSRHATAVQSVVLEA